VQLPLQAPVLLFQLLDRTLARPGGRQCRQLLFPLFDALVADAQFTGDLLHRFAALEPQLDRGAFEVLVVPLVFARDSIFVVHGVLCVSSHNP
jgi:hypothetical protein